MTTGTMSVTAALEGVAAWRADQETRRKAEIAEADAKLDALRASLKEIQAKIADVSAQRDEIEARDTTDEMVSKTYEAIFAAMLGQASALAERADLALAARQAHYDRVITGLPTSEIAARVLEYTQFKTQVEASLTGLPESYRSAIMSHHRGVSEQIRVHLARELDGDPPVAAPLLEVDMVYGVDAPEGKPELLICVLPIADAAFTDWADRPEDLATRLGARVVQGIYETTRQTGPVGAQAVCGGHQGLLAIEVDLEGARADVARILADNLQAVLKSAPEFGSAKVKVIPRKVDVDFLLPPDTTEEA